jgi:beta-phosphoglucomutase
VDKEIKGIIFDLDGVIVFTDELHYEAWQSMADELGVYFDKEINHLLRGVSRMESLEIVLRNYHGEPLSETEKIALAEKKNAIYKTLLEKMEPSDVDDCVRSTLKELKERGYLLAIGSSSKNAKRILERVELIHEFDAISDGTNIAKSKPDPEVFIKAAEFLGLKPQQCLVVEDADAGIEAALKGGMHSAAIGPATKIGKAKYNLNTFSDLLHI